MKAKKKRNLTRKEMDELILRFSKELVSLRGKAKISQGELANMIGVSRQTYGAIERGDRKMTWCTYLALILFYDYNSNTHQMIRDIGVFPTKITDRFNSPEDNNRVNIMSLLDDRGQGLVKKLDERALSSIRTMMMVEYARCANISGDAAIRAFDGISFVNGDEDDERAAKALRGIRKKKRNDNQ